MTDTSARRLSDAIIVQSHQMCFDGSNSCSIIQLMLRHSNIIAGEGFQVLNYCHTSSGRKGMANTLFWQGQSVLKKGDFFCVLILMYAEYAHFRVK
jgi:hypothetical protein